MLLDPEGRDRPRSFWEQSAHALLVGCVLHVLYAERDKSLAGCARLLADPRRPVRAVLDLDPRTASGVIGHAQSRLDLFRDPILAANTAASDFTAEDLVGGERPVALYITIAPADVATAELLSRMTGQMTVNLVKRSLSGASVAVTPRKTTVSQQEVGRPLLTPDEVRRLPEEEALIFAAGHAPIRARRVPYYRDAALAGRCGKAAPERSDRVGTRSEWEGWEGVPWWCRSLRESSRRGMTRSLRRAWAT